MTLQNRVIPTGEIIADPSRGEFMGNRGILHNQTKTLGKARWKHKAWITCLLAFRGRRSDVMPKNRYTRLFLLDEAVALAAGHRPCYECRRADYHRYMDHWALAHKASVPRAGEVDKTLHHERVDAKTRRQITTRMQLDDLPDGAFILLDNNTMPFLVYGDALFGFIHSTYEVPIKRPRMTTVTALTPPSSLKVLQSGFTPILHSSVVR